MKNTKKYIKLLCLLFMVSTVQNCLDFEDLRENPNNPNAVGPSLIFTALTPRPTESFSGTYVRVQNHIWISTDSNSPVSLRAGFGGSFNGYNSARNIIKMNEEADKSNAPVYKILGKFFRAYNYIEMTRRMGDIPLSEAEKDSEIPRPKYDTQKSVYIQCFKWLDEVNTELGNFIKANPSATIDGDLYYGGDLKKWQKLLNAYTLRILISLSKKADDAEVNVKGRFAAIINDPNKYPLFSSIADNAQFTFKNANGFKQLYNPDRAVYRVSVNYANTYINLLKATQDPRLMKVADPTRFAVEEGEKANPPVSEAKVRADFDSYAGADPTINPELNKKLQLAGKISVPNEKRYWNFVGQPGIWISYWEQEFCIAEAAHRGWISSNAKTHYDNAVKASMDWYGVDAGKITAFLAATPSQYIAGAPGLTRILEQKYVAFGENSGQEAFFNYRRTGVPNLPFSKFNGSDELVYPKRWVYPSSENGNNEANYKAALKRQFGVESDDVDFVIWELKD